MDPADIVKIAGTAGIISTTTFWSMNFTINYVTFPALLLGDVPKTTSSPSRFLIPSTSSPFSPSPFLTRQWQEVYWRGHRWGPASAILSGVAFATASWFSGQKSNQQYLYATAAVAAVSVVPWTLAVMVPVNDELHRRGDAQVGGGGTEAGKEAKGDGRDVLDLVRDWLLYNNVRASIALVGTVAGVMAYLQ